MILNRHSPMPQKQLKSPGIVRSRSILALLTVGWVLVAAACGGSSEQVKPNEVVKEVTKSEREKFAEEVGMKPDALEAFQTGTTEMRKAEPDKAAAMGQFKTAVELEPQFAEAHYNLGLLLAEMGQHEKARDHFRTAREIDPSSMDYTVALGRTHAMTGEFEKAEKLFREVIARDEVNLTAKNNLALLALKRGDDEEAMEQVRAILREDDEHIGALKTLSLIYRKRENLSLAKYILEEKALKIQEKKYKKPSADLHNNLGLVYMDLENVPAAVSQFQLANKADTDFLESRLNLGAILLEYLDYKRADEQFNHALKLAPDHCVARLGRAASAFALGDKEESDQHYRFYLDSCDADHVSSLQRLAKLNETLDVDKAIGYYQQLIGLTSDEAKRSEYKAMVGFLESSKKAEQPKPAPDAASNEEDGQANDAEEPSAAESEGLKEPAEEPAK